MLSQNGLCGLPWIPWIGVSVGGHRQGSPLGTVSGRTTEEILAVQALHRGDIEADGHLGQDGVLGVGRPLATVIAPDGRLDLVIVFTLGENVNEVANTDVLLAGQDEVLLHNGLQIVLVLPLESYGKDQLFYCREDRYGKMVQKFYLV